MQNSENTTKPIKLYLNNNNSTFSNLYKKALSIRELDHKLKNLIDPSLRNQFELANINAEIVVILVNNSAWATRLRYNIPVILNVLNNQLNFKNVKTVRIKIKQPISNKSSPVKRTVPLSKNAAQFLEDTANTIDDPDLRNCFLKLSKNHQ